MEQADEERKAYEHDELVKMIATPGWQIFEDYVRKQIKKAKTINCINAVNDEEIIRSFKLAQSRASVYNTLLDYVNKRTSQRVMEEK